MRVPLTAFLTASLLCSWSAICLSQDEPSVTPDESGIREAVQSYVKAFNARDAKALADHWSPQAVYTSRSSGEQMVGREAITEEFTRIFSGDAVPTLGVETASIDFVSPNVAIESGTATITAADESVSQTEYSVVYINHGGTWLIDRVTEDEIIQIASNYDRLSGLEFLIGEWIDAGDRVTIRTSCQWTRNRNYISRTYSVEEDGEVSSSGLQIIGWDARKEQIRSWLFDSSGTFVQAEWRENNGTWMSQSIASLADGGRGSFTSVFRPIDDDSYGWQKVDRIIDGQLMPSVDEVIVVRD